MLWLLKINLLLIWNTDIALDNRDLEKGLISATGSQNSPSEPSPAPSPSAATPPALVLSNSGKRIDQAGRKKYVKKVTGRHNDTELHLAAQRGDLVAVKEILNINSQMVGTLSSTDFDREVAEIRASVVNEVNELGETALYTAAERGHFDVVKELLKYSNRETLVKKNQSMFDPLHIAAREGHHGDYLNSIVLLFDLILKYSRYCSLVAPPVSVM